MPDLSGKNSRNAFKILKGKILCDHIDFTPYHLKIEKKYVPSAKNRGVIVRQLPSPGHPLKAGETVTLYISEGITSKHGTTETFNAKMASVKSTKPEVAISHHTIRTNISRKPQLPALELSKIRVSQTEIHRGEPLKLNISEKTPINIHRVSFYIGRKKVFPETFRHTNEILLPTGNLPPGKYPVLLHHGRHWKKVGMIRILKIAHSRTSTAKLLVSHNSQKLVARPHEASLSLKKTAQTSKYKPRKSIHVNHTQSKSHLKPYHENTSYQHRAEKKFKSFVFSVNAEQYSKLKKTLAKNSAWVKIEKKRFIKSLHQVLVAVKTTNPEKTKNLAKELSARKFIRTFQPNHTYRTYGNAGDPYIDWQYGCLPAEKLRNIHKVCNGKNTRIALLDTGVDTRHEDLNAKHIVTVDFTSEGWGRYHSDIHGTALCGILSATPGNGKGIAGLVPESKIFAIKVCRSIRPGSIEATTDTFTLAAGLDYIIQKRIKLVNISIGGPKDHLIEKLIGKARVRGTVIVAAVGNGGPRAPPSYPAAFSGVIGVTAIDQNLKLYDKAPWGRFVDVAAPGVDVFSLKPGNRYNFYTGTSFATAYVTGILALQYSCFVNHPGKETWRSILRKFAFKPLSYCPEKFGLGILILSKISKKSFLPMNFTGKNITY